MTEQELIDRINAAERKIGDAYWCFTRCARAKPPVLVVPEAYAERNAAKAELRELRASRRANR